MNQLQVLGKQKIGNFEFIAIEGGFGEDKKAMTVKDIAGIHETTVKRINEVINNNSQRFIDGVDIIDLKSKVVQNDLVEEFGFDAHSVRMSKNIYILSERGYAKLLKILEDDTAWEIYDELVDNYFSMREQIKIPTSTRELIRLALAGNEETNQRLDGIDERLIDIEENKLITTEDKGTIDRAIRKKVHQICKEQHLGQNAKNMLYQDLGSSIKQLFNVPNRGRIKDKDFRKALNFINSWEPSSVTKERINQIQTDLFDN
ncbi:ORF6C domain-containing protein [Enterococcus pernyi]|uniref:ORF6C domain-containing protein n=1 Tax=Enterococcus pernyi TaxID=590158 RepID=UPI000789AEE3|nr:ORF6C domain-containing protein [Enterococcus pernyi]